MWSFGLCTDTKPGWFCLSCCRLLFNVLPTWLKSQIILLVVARQSTMLSCMFEGQLKMRNLFTFFLSAVFLCLQLFSRLSLNCLAANFALSSNTPCSPVPVSVSSQTCFPFFCMLFFLGSCQTQDFLLRNSCTARVYHSPFSTNARWDFLLLLSALLRLFVVVLTGVAVLIIPMMEGANGGEIYRYATLITGYLGAPTCAMFLLAMFWSRVSEMVDYKHHPSSSQSHFMHKIFILSNNL